MELNIFEEFEVSILGYFFVDDFGFIYNIYWFDFFEYFIFGLLVFILILFNGVSIVIKK